MSIRIQLFLIPLLALLALPAEAVESENFTFEGRLFYWNTSFDATVRSDNVGIAGSNIDVVSDLGLAKEKGVVGFEATLKFAERHKLRLNRVALAYSAQTNLENEITFAGVTYPVNIPTRGTMDVTTTVVTYDYDMVRNDDGFFSIRFGADIVKLAVRVENGVTINWADFTAPVPVLGFAGRRYFTPRFYAGFDLVGSAYNNSSLFDFAASVGYDFNQNLGLFAGYRAYRIDVNVDNDSGKVNWGGLIAGAAFRF